MTYKFNITNNLVTSFEVNGETYTLKTSLSPTVLEGLIATQSTIYLTDDTLYSFKSGGGTSSTTGSDKTLLRYILTKDKLLQGTELTETDPSVPSVNGNKGFLTSASESTLLSFYQAFAYNEENYELMIKHKDIEISFLCSDRRYGVAGTRRAWSPYFKISDLISQSFVNIQNRLVGTDQSAEYFFKAKITLNANGNLFITLIDGHSGVNLYGSILNIRHRVS